METRYKRLPSRRSGRRPEEVAIPPSGSGQFQLRRQKALTGKIPWEVVSQSHRPDLVDSNACQLLLMRSLRKSQSHHPDLVNSERDWYDTTSRQMGFSRNPTVPTWSIPSYIVQEPDAAGELLSQSHHLALVNSNSI